MSTAVLPRGYIDGLITANASGDSDHDLDIEAGETRDALDVFDIRLAAALTKQIDADWAEGSDAGGFPSGLTLAADTWYHVFVISNGTRTDAGFDTSDTAANLLADATGYSYYRRVASVRTDASSNVTAYHQEAGYFLWKEPLNADAQQTLNNTTAVSLTLTVPPIAVRLLANASVSQGSSPSLVRVSVYSPEQDDQTNTFQELDATGAGATNLISQNYLELLTNSSRQIRAKTDSGGLGTKITINTRGWFDFRGQE